MIEASCPFCLPADTSVFYKHELVQGIWDRYPVTKGHALLTTRRHIAGWTNTTNAERAALTAAIDVAVAEISRRHQPDGFNIGFNDGIAAGQTIFHLHVHVIPRYNGDVADPRGGVRHVIPHMANYLQLQHGGVELLSGAPHARPMVRGGDDPLLPHLRADLDRASAADLAVAFVMRSGTQLLVEHLRDLLDRGGRLRLITGDYMGLTEPQALLQLLDLRGNLDLRVFETRGRSFHPKAYILHRADGAATAYVGSSNLSASALGSGIEWNYRTVTSEDTNAYRDVVAAFDALFTHPATRPIDHAWVEAYRNRRDVTTAFPRTEVEPEPPASIPPPHQVQQEALAALEATRRDGNAAGLVVMATGLGKTWLSVFDSNRPEFRRILFVAHREEILAQAMSTFRRVRPDAVMGRFTGGEKLPHADILFASIQTLGRARHLDTFAPDAFDYVVVDEFHHAAARTYRNLIGHFQPRFLLGLTATPERSDGGDLLSLCGENLVYRCDFFEGIRRGLLCAFQYFGVPDPVDYTNIPWRSNRFDEEALTTAVATKKRAQNALEQHQKRAGSRTLAFCCSQRHADFMAEYFRDANLRAVAVHAGPASAPRAASLEDLQAGRLDVVFAVDMFNEGVDIPLIDTVMMLRPTESPVLWLQQFGRGLRRADDKSHLRVIDYIGNHRIFLLKPRTLLGLGSGDRDLDKALNLIAERKAELPPGCEVTYDLEAIDLMRSLLRLKSWRDTDVLETYYRDFRERHGVRPTPTETFHDGYNPRGLRRTDGAWFRFVARMGDLDDSQRIIMKHADASAFLDALETTPMTKGFKMLVLLAMINLDAFPGQITAADLAAEFRRLTRRSAALRSDVGSDLDDNTALVRLIEQNPIAAWVGGRGTRDRSFFKYQDGVLSAQFEVPVAARAAFQEMARELAEWRLTEYLQRPAAADGVSAVVCKVAQTNGRPILFMDRKGRPDIPSGWIDISVDGEPFSANLAKIAVNVLRKPGSEDNVLADVLRKWFGPDAGMPGTRHRVALRELDGGWELRPLKAVEEEAGCRPWRQYMRQQIPEAFGFPFSTAVWNQGFVVQPNHLFLLVTLEKQDMDAYQYEDRFLAPDLFQWQSQNRTSQNSKHGEMIQDHAKRNTTVHLFVRRDKKVNGVSAPFVYCGPVSFVSWQGETPITVKWRLAEPVPPELHALLKIG